MTTHNDLKSRVGDFERMALPGQPRMMHMGTAYLVHDIWNHAERIRAALENIANHPSDGPPDWAQNAARAALNEDVNK